MGNTDLMIPQDTSGYFQLKGKKERSWTRLARQVGVPEITGVLGESWGGQAMPEGVGGICEAPEGSRGLAEEAEGTPVQAEPFSVAAWAWSRDCPRGSGHPDPWLRVPRTSL